VHLLVIVSKTFNSIPVESGISLPLQLYIYIYIFFKWVSFKGYIYLSFSLCPVLILRQNTGVLGQRNLRWCASQYK